MRTYEINNKFDAGKIKGGGGRRKKKEIGKCYVCAPIPNSEYNLYVLKIYINKSNTTTKQK